MEQFEREYREALDGLRFSNAGKERIVKNLMEQGTERPVKARRFRPLRAGLVAAALCLALVGTAFAATAVYRLTAQHYISLDGEWTGYSIYGDVTCHPLEDFSPELQTACRVWEDETVELAAVEVGFDTWAEIQAFLGDNVPLIWPDTALYPDRGGYLLLWPNFDTRELWCINVVLHSPQEAEKPYYISMYLYGEGRPASEDGSVFTFRGDSSTPRRFEFPGSYDMASGNRAELVMDLGQEDDFQPSLNCTGYFIHCGVLYHVGAYGTADYTTQFDQLSRVRRLLDSYPA